ncbi:hypothetical protein WJX74_002679 [Apatococcus lobatus]|uniref:Uncharacterized protein n=1 Tax=Apatococcus lobatus TaxID=904363 RepID=A0AAW1Q5S8_9CHLO
MPYPLTRSGAEVLCHVQGIIRQQAWTAAFDSHTLRQLWRLSIVPAGLSPKAIWPDDICSPLLQVRTSKTSQGAGVCLCTPHDGGSFALLSGIGQLGDLIVSSNMRPVAILDLSTDRRLLVLTPAAVAGATNDTHADWQALGLPAMAGPAAVW